MAEIIFSTIWFVVGGGLLSWVVICGIPRLGNPATRNGETPAELLKRLDDAIEETIQAKRDSHRTDVNIWVRHFVYALPEGAKEREVWEREEEARQVGAMRHYRSRVDEFLFEGRSARTADDYLRDLDKRIRDSEAGIPGSKRAWGGTILK